MSKQRGCLKNVSHGVTKTTKKKIVLDCYCFVSLVSLLGMKKNDF